jgi:hypothetical protein
MEVTYNLLIARHDEMIPWSHPSRGFDQIESVLARLPALSITIVGAVGIRMRVPPVEPAGLVERRLLHARRPPTLAQRTIRRHVVASIGGVRTHVNARPRLDSRGLYV